MRRIPVLAASLGIALLLASLPARAIVMGAGKRNLAAAPRTGPMTVRVAWPGGEPAGGVSVVAAGAARVADDKGVVTVPEGAPSPYRVVVARAARLEGGFLGLFRKSVPYAAFERYEPRPGQAVEVALRLAPVPEGGIDALCLGCHPEPKVVGIIPGVKCAHPSGVPLKPALAGQVAKYNSENKKLRAEKKEAWGDIRLREGKKGWFGSEGAPVMTCESCHTVHVDTGVPAYAVAPFSDRSILCRGCHV